MAAGTYHITAERNEALLINMTYQDDAGIGIDLNGTTVNMYLKDNPTDSTAIDEFNPKVLTVTNATDGEFEISISKEDINAIPFDQGIYYIDLSGTIETRLIEGKFQIKNNSSY
jgi:hypothetical protein